MKNCFSNFPRSKFCVSIFSLLLLACSQQAPWQPKAWFHDAPEYSAQAKSFDSNTDLNFEVQVKNILHQTDSEWSIKKIEASAPSFQGKTKNDFKEQENIWKLEAKSLSQINAQKIIARANTYYGLRAIYLSRSARNRPKSWDLDIRSQFSTSQLSSDQKLLHTDFQLYDSVFQLLAQTPLQGKLWLNTVELKKDALDIAFQIQADENNKLLIAQTASFLAAELDNIELQYQLNTTLLRDKAYRFSARFFFKGKISSEEEQAQETFHSSLSWSPLEAP